MAFNIFAAAAVVAAEAAEAGLAHSPIAYADAKAIAGQKAKAGSCTPCAAAARLDRARQQVAVATGAAPPPRPRVRKAG